MINRQWIVVGMVTVASLGMAGCAGVLDGGSSRPAPEINREMTVQFGVVEGLREVAVHERTGNSGVGALVGGVVGGLAGNAIGNDLTTVAGAVAGGLIGNKIEKNKDENKRQAGVEISIRLDNGRNIVIAQPIDPGAPLFRVGDRVRVLTSQDGSVRVSFR